MELEAGQRRALLATVVLANVMANLDLTITNISLATIAGQMGATMAEASWLLTAYVVGAAIALPLTGYLNDRLGQRRLFVGTIIGFAASSLLCGASTSMEVLTLARFLQGLFSAPIAPIGTAVMATVYPGAQLQRVMAYFSMSMLVVPILGPAFGGWVTETIGWRWLFLANAPVGALIVAAALRHMDAAAVKARVMDWLGFISVAAVLVSFQFVAELGQHRGWLDSPSIVAALFVGGAALAVLTIHYVSRPAAVVLNLGCLRDRNFALGFIAAIPFAVALWGGQFLQPFLFQQQYGHSPSEAGVLLMPRALASLAAMYLVSKVGERIGMSTLLFVGGVLATVACFWMTRMSPDMTGWWLAPALALQGFGIGMVFVPLGTLPFTTLPREQMAEASTLYFLARNAASALGIAGVSVYATTQADGYWAKMGEHLTPYAPAVQDYAARLQVAPDSVAGAVALGAELARQASMAAFIDAQWLATAATLVLVPLALVLGRQTKAAAT